MFYLYVFNSFSSLIRVSYLMCMLVILVCSVLICNLGAIFCHEISGKTFLEHITSYQGKSCLKLVILLWMIPKNTPLHQALSCMILLGDTFQAIVWQKSSRTHLIWQRWPCVILELSWKKLIVKIFQERTLLGQRATGKKINK